MTEPPGKLHHNSFGALRLMLAYAVIVSHSPEMLDGNPSREPLMAMGLHVTFGGLAVDGFFIISGYLIASSYLSSRSLAQFLTSRILRIYPAFICAFLLCILLVGPIAGGMLDALGVRGWLAAFAKMISLGFPEVPGAFHTLPIPSLDGSMWTIRYEFRCYLLVALLGVLGFLDKRKFILVLTGLLYVGATFISMVGVPDIPRGHLHQFIFGFIGDPAWVFSLTAIFMSGVCARLYRDKLRFRPITVFLSGFIVCVAATPIWPFPDLAIGTAGAFLLLWAVTGLKSKFLQRINNNYDFSYGVYLYAWPIASLIMLGAQKFGINLAPMLLTCATAVVSTLVAAVSWYVVERPTLRLKLQRRMVTQPSAPYAVQQPFDS
jgi:peptidoglycan/LPS O-acetylase OafA/YrhL